MKLKAPTLLLLVSLWMAAPWAYAQQGANATAAGNWASLSTAQRQALAPLAKQWDQLPADSQRKWMEIAQRFPTLPPEQQSRVQQRMTEWSRLTPTQRGEARLNFQESRQLPAANRQAQWEAYQALPAEQRQALAAKARPLDSAPATSLPPRSAAQALRAAPLDAQAPKENTVPKASSVQGGSRAVAPTLVQPPAGATTALVSARPQPPVHQQAGQSKVVVDAAHVNKTTLLPRPAASAAIAPGKSSVQDTQATTPQPPASAPS